MQIKSFSLDRSMTTKLPSQEEFENWTASQVADLLRQVLNLLCNTSENSVYIQLAETLNGFILGNQIS